VAYLSNPDTAYQLLFIADLNGAMSLRETKTALNVKIDNGALASNTWTHVDWEVDLANTITTIRVGSAPLKGVSIATFWKDRVNDDLTLRLGTAYGDSNRSLRFDNVTVE
jgi:hypothetical protein